jgi:hypothetical protein
MEKGTRLSGLSELPGDVPQSSEYARPEDANTDEKWASTKGAAYSDCLLSADSSHTFVGRSPRLGGVDFINLDS